MLTINTGGKEEQRRLNRIRLFLERNQYNGIMGEVFELAPSKVVQEL